MNDQPEYMWKVGASGYSVYSHILDTWYSGKTLTDACNNRYTAEDKFFKQVRREMGMKS